MATARCAPNAAASDIGHQIQGKDEDIRDKCDRTDAAKLLWQDHMPTKAQGLFLSVFVPLRIVL